MRCWDWPAGAVLHCTARHCGGRARGQNTFLDLCRNKIMSGRPSLALRACPPNRTAAAPLWPVARRACSASSARAPSGLWDRGVRDARGVKGSGGRGYLPMALNPLSLGLSILLSRSRPPRCAWVGVAQPPRRRDDRCKGLGAAVVSALAPGGSGSTARTTLPTPARRGRVELVAFSVECIMNCIGAAGVVEMRRDSQTTQGVDERAGRRGAAASCVLEMDKNALADNGNGATPPTPRRRPVDAPSPLLQLTSPCPLPRRAQKGRAPGEGRVGVDSSAWGRCSLFWDQGCIPRSRCMVGHQGASSGYREPRVQGAYTTFFKVHPLSSKRTLSSGGASHGQMHSF